MANWVSQLDNTLYTIIKYKLNKEFLAKYPSMRITNSSRSPTKTEFPTIYIQTLGNKEVGSTFDIGVNAISYDIQIETTALDESTAREISDFIVECMLERHFKVNVNSLQNNTDTTYGRISRFTRLVGANDTL